MSLSIQRVDDVVEAHEISDERQILAIARLIRVCECASDDVAKLADVTHVNAAHSWIKGKSPAPGSVRLLLRSQCAHQALVIEGCDDEGVILKPGLPDYLV